ncbi:hypothetical protein BTR23_12025 [Alkalihalophilus pseudofirmus]|nr:hypothetical protein BTR23_12025 [Alkalihalophilus pseudofirmus]
MNVKLKRKHLLWGSLGFMALFLVATFIIAPFIQEKKIDRFLATGDPKVGNEIIDLIENAKTDSRKLNLIQKYVLSWSTKGYEHPVYMSPGLSTWHEAEETWGGFTLEETEPYLRFYLNKGPKMNAYYVNAVVDYAHYLRKTEGFEEATQFLEQKEEEWKRNPNYYFDEMFMLTRPKMLLEAGQTEAAIALLLEIETEEKQRLKEHQYEYGPTEMWTTHLVEALLREHRLTEAHERIEAWEQADKKMREEWAEWEEEETYAEGFDRPLLVLKQRIESLMRDGKNEDFGTVEGQIVRKDGTPLEGVFVYLRDPGNVNRSAHADMDYLVTRTNEEGYYRFSDVLPNSYQVGLGLQYAHVDGYAWPVDMYDWFQVDYGTELTYDITFLPLMDMIQPVNNVEETEDEITFAWKPMEKAKTYELSIFVPFEKGGGFSVPVRRQISQSSITLSVQELANLHTTGAYSFDENGVIFEPERLLGLSNPDGKYSWSVRAFDESGQEVGRSDGYRLSEATMGEVPFFHLMHRELSASDKLLLKKQIEEALVSYKQDVERDPHDVHALRMITVLLEHQSREGDQELNCEQYYDYMERLATLTDHPDHYYHFVGKAREENDWLAYDEWFGKYEKALKLRGEQPNYYVAKEHGRALMEQEKWSEAKEWLYYALKNDRSNETVIELLALELYLGTSLDTVVSLAEDHPVLSDGFENWTPYVQDVVVDEEMKAALHTYLRKGAEAVELPHSKGANQAFLQQLVNHR